MLARPCPPRSTSAPTPSPTPPMPCAARWRPRRVGDDVFGDDPTVNELEARAAALLGKEAGLFVASGTMGNLVSLMAHLPRGHEAIAGESTHTVMDEAGGHAVVVGATIRALRERADGTMDPAEIERRVPRPRRTSTSPSPASSSSRTPTPTPAAGRCRSTTWSASPRIAHERGVPLHVDGARFFNAAVALGLAPAALAAPADTVTFCLSKGLVGADRLRGGRARRPFIARARRARKLLGGGMRQVGVLAAAGPRGARRRPGRDDRPPRRGPRQRAPPRRGPGRARPASARPAASPSRTRTGRWTRPAP